MTESTDPPSHPAPHAGQARVGAAAAAYEAGRFDEAERICVAVLDRDPGEFDAMRLLGLLQHRAGGCAEALTSYDRALALRPDHAETLNNRGNVLIDLKRFAEALASYDKALRVEPQFADAHYNRGLLLKRLKRCEDALESLDAALVIRPDYAQALNTRGTTLYELDRHEEALASYDKALAIRPAFAEAFNNRGVALYRTRHFDEALASYDQAIAVRPAYAEAFNNRGVALKELRRIEEALASYGKAQQLAPDYADPHWNEALLRLLIGDFAAGLAKYEWRWQRPSFTSPLRNFPQPQWDGTELFEGKTILLHGEQGFGDVIQFCRYVPQVTARGARVILEVAQPLCGLMGSLGAAEIVAAGSRLPPFDLHCPLMSLPLALGTRLDTIPAAVPYLAAPTDAAAAWETRLGPRKRPRIGIAWAGNPRQENDRNRSASLTALLPLLDIDATFVSLQKDLRAGDDALLRARDDIVKLGGALADFSDAAALVSRMDVVVSVDTSIAHLAGALGKPVFVLLCFTPDWRWLIAGDTNPWYPTARLFRQTRPQDWDEPVAEVAAVLKAMVAQDDGRTGAAQRHGNAWV
jgi:tetratricopeptide (TPR) repeat protein